LYDTFGFPIDLTILIAGEMGISVDVEGFERALDEQRERSRAAAGKDGQPSLLAERVTTLLAGDAARATFVGYGDVTAPVETRVLTDAATAAAGVLVLAESPFYATSGGQVADTGVVEGEGWRFLVTDVQKDADLGQRLLGTLEGSFA